MSARSSLTPTILRIAFVPACFVIAFFACKAEEASDVPNQGAADGLHNAMIPSATGTSSATCAIDASPACTVSFANNVDPILTTTCGISGCHIQGGQAPNITGTSDYQTLTNFTYSTFSGDYVIGCSPTASASPMAGNIDLPGGGPLNGGTQVGDKMPETGSLPADGGATILAWLACGALNN